MSEHIESGNGQIIFWVILALLLLGGAVLILPFMPALLWASVLAVLIFPFFRWLHKVFGGSEGARSWASLISTVGLLFVIIIPIGGALFAGGVEVYDFVDGLVRDAEAAEKDITLGELGREADEYLEPWLQRVGLEEFKLSTWVDENKENLAKNISGPLVGGIKKVVMMIVSVVIALLTMFFMLKDGHRLVNPVVELMPLPRDRCLLILERLATTVRSVFTSVVVVAFVQGLLAGAAYYALGVPSAAAWMFLTILMAMIPFLGAPVVFVPCSIFLFLNEKPLQGGILLAIGFLVISNIDNFLKPIIISRGANLHTMAIFFSLLGGILALGPIGLVAGPMLITLILAMLDVLRERQRVLDGLPPLDA